MNINEWMELLQTVGVPSIVAGASFWFIRYMFDSATKEREEFMQQDRENDERIFLLAENSNKALTDMAKSLDDNTASLDLFRNALVNGSTGKRRR
tara:strand:+ start:238 stop:522 length:285 start_codon:yes stop_codon:yes gene_type:complete